MDEKHCGVHEFERYTDFEEIVTRVFRINLILSQKLNPGFLTFFFKDKIGQELGIHRQT